MPNPTRTTQRAASRLRHRAPMTGPLVRTAGGLAVRAAIGVVGGIALGAAALAADELIGWSLPFEVSRVHDLLTTLTGASLTIAVFALWMRSIVVGLVAGEFQPRTLAHYLDDGFQRAIAGWMIAAFSLLVTVTVGMPPPELGTVPPVATLLAFGTLVAALLGILLAVRHASTQLDTSNLVHELAYQAFGVLEQMDEVADDPPSSSPHRPERAIDTDQLGWVRHVDRHALVRRLPDGAHAELLVTPGSFVSPGQSLLTVDVQIDETDAEAMRAAVDVGRIRDGNSDLAFSIEALTDVARNAAGPGGDIVTAREVLRYLEALLRRLLERGLPTGNLRDGDRLLTTTAEPTIATYVGRAAAGLRRAARADPQASEDTEALLERLAARADELGLDDAAEAARSSDGGSHTGALADDQDGGG